MAAYRTLIESLLPAQACQTISRDNALALFKPDRTPESVGPSS